MTAPVRTEQKEDFHGLPAPSKLNLFLHVVGRRDDGYHLLQSAFQLIDLADTLDLDELASGRIERRLDVPQVPEAEDLCVRAARALQQAVGATRGVSIALHKEIPMGGGLGGGSSDAATVLIALNRLWQLGLTQQQLMAIGLSLGADVPFFLFGGNAFAEGVGEVLQAIQTPERFYAVIHPGIGVPTAAIFGDPGLTRNTSRLKISDFCAGAHAVATERLGADFGHNDLEAVAVARFPAVASALQWLGQFGQARMTGSGACVFAGFKTREAALASLEGMPREWRAWVCASLSSHPLSSWIPA